MPNCFSHKTDNAGFCPTVFVAATLVPLASQVAFAGGGGISGGSTEFTQILNNGQLVQLAGQSAQQINNQITQISQLAQQIENQLKIYQNMLQNTAQLPNHEWGQVESDLNQLRSVVNQGQGIAFSMGNVDDVLKQRFQSYTDFQANLPTATNFSATYQTWSNTNRDTISGSLRAANLTSDQLGSEETTMAQLQSMSESADGQMKALQVGHEIAAQEVAQMQKLRGLVSQQMTMMATWYQSEQSEKDLAQARRQQFFQSTAPSNTGGQEMQPRW